MGTEVIKLTNNNKVYINNNNKDLGKTSSNQSDMNKNNKKINKSNSLDNNNIIRLTNLINKLNNIKSSDKQQLENQKVLLVPEKIDQFRINMEEENNEYNNKKNINNINIINNNINQYINNDNENNKNTNNTTDKDNTNNNMLNNQNISDTNTNDKNQINSVDDIPLIESLEKNNMGPKDKISKKQNKLNNNNDINNNDINENIDVYNNNLNKNNISPLKKIPLDNYKSKTSDKKNTRKIEDIKNNSFEPYLNIDINTFENNNYDHDKTNLTYNNINKSPKENVHVVKLIKNEKEPDYNDKDIYSNNNINDGFSRTIPVYTSVDNPSEKNEKKHFKRNNTNYLNNNNIVKELITKDENDINAKKETIDYERLIRPILSEKDFYKNLKNNGYQDNNTHSDSDELDNKLIKKSLKIEDLNFDDSINNINKDAGDEEKNIKDKNNDYNKGFNNHDKFYQEMKNLLEKI